MSRRSRPDRNQGDVVARFLALGCSVVELHDAGIPGFPDLVVGCAGVNRLVEVKNPDTRYGRAGLNANQRVFDRDWRGERMWTVASPEEATAVVQNWRRGKA